MDVFGEVQLPGQPENVDSLYYSNVDYMSLVQQNLCSGNDVSEILGKVNEQGVIRLIDHVVAKNLRSATELAIIRGAIEKHESVFKGFGGHDMGRLSVDLQDIGKL